MADPNWNSRHIELVVQAPVKRVAPYLRALASAYIRGSFVSGGTTYYVHPRYVRAHALGKGKRRDPSIIIETFPTRDFNVKPVSVIGTIEARRLDGDRTQLDFDCPSGDLAYEFALIAFQIRHGRKEVPSDRTGPAPQLPASLLSHSAQAGAGMPIGLPSPNPKPQVPRRGADLRKWKNVYSKIKGWSDLSYNEISRKLDEDPKMRRQPHSPDTIAKILAAGAAGLLDKESHSLS